MKKIALFVVLAFLSGTVFAESGVGIIRKLDRNQVFKTQKYSATMTINKDGRTLVKKFRGYGMTRGKQSFMEYYNPEDRGVKYLKKGNELWIYFPDADDIMRISGHMLRKGMMGSDLSYEDMMEEDSLEDQYAITLAGEKNIRGIHCYVLDLKAKKRSVTYARQVVYVDKRRYVAIEVEMYAKGGRLIKKMTQSDFASARGRWYARKFTIKDMRKRNSLTTITFDSIVFDVHVPRSVFSKRNLKR
jgi:outer membrane lipoprotein-sorting protein